MNSGFYSAAIQMAIGNVNKMDVHSSNLANSAMPGFKKVDLSTTAFSDELDKEVAPMHNLGGEAVVNYAQGALRTTERTLDFAIDGKGFFVVSKDGQDYLTRNGNFKISPDGTVVNSLGMAVQVEDGDLIVPPLDGTGRLQVDQERFITMDNQDLGQLKLIHVEDTRALKQIGSTLFLNDGAEETPGTGSVVNGFLESSNAVVFEEMVGMMTTLRNYEACQRMLRTVSEADQKMMSKLT